MAKSPVRNLEANERTVGPDDYNEPIAPVERPRDPVVEPSDDMPLAWRIATAIGYKITPHVENGQPARSNDPKRPNAVVFDGRFPEWDILTPDNLILGFRIPQSEVAAQFPDWLNDPVAALSLKLDDSGERMWIVMCKIDGSWWVAIRDDDGEMSQTYGKSSHAKLATAASLAWLEANET